MHMITFLNNLPNVAMTKGIFQLTELWFSKSPICSWGQLNIFKGSSSQFSISLFTKGAGLSYVADLMVLSPFRWVLFELTLQWS